MGDDRLARFFFLGYVFLTLLDVVLIITGFNTTLILLIGAILPGMFMFRLEYYTLSVGKAFPEVLRINRLTGSRSLAGNMLSK